MLSITKPVLLTRLESERITYLRNSLRKLKLPNDQHKIKYLYFECFNKLESDPSIALKEIQKSIHNNKNLSHLYQFFKLIQTN